MSKYRKKPVVIEAFQMTEERRWNSGDWPEWLHAAWNEERQEFGSFYCRPLGGIEIYIHTLEGEMVVSFDDWIIQGIKGELYPCKPDIFELTYEEVKP